MDSAIPRKDLPPFHFAVSATPTAFTVHVGGEVDLSTVGVLHARLTETELDGQTPVYLDLQGLAFCDSRGGRVLLAFIQRAQQSGHQIAVGGATPTIKRLLSLIAGGDQPPFE